MLESCKGIKSFLCAVEDLHCSIVGIDCLGLHLENINRALFLNPRHWSLFTLVAKQHCLEITYL
jgi:hypothetical protein